MTDQKNRWYKIGFDEGCDLGNPFDPPQYANKRFAPDYRRGFNDSRTLHGGALAPSKEDKPA